nr:hypothetical protein CFP56_64003 [Quercus suber]
MGPRRSKRGTEVSVCCDDWSPPPSPTHSSRWGKWLDILDVHPNEESFDACFFSRHGLECCIGIRIGNAGLGEWRLDAKIERFSVRSCALSNLITAQGSFVTVKARSNTGHDDHEVVPVYGRLQWWYGRDCSEPPSVQQQRNGKLCTKAHSGNEPCVGMPRVDPKAYMNLKTCTEEQRDEIFQRAVAMVAIETMAEEATLGEIPHRSAQRSTKGESSTLKRDHDMETALDDLARDFIPKISGLRSEI